MTNNQGIKQRTYHVKGMHCAACEVLIEKTLLDRDGIEAVDASANEELVTITYQGKPPTIEDLNQSFADGGYRFSTKAFVKDKKVLPIISRDDSGHVQVNPDKLQSWAITLCISLTIILIFIMFSRSGLSSIVSVNAPCPFFRDNSGRGLSSSFRSIYRYHSTDYRLPLRYGISNTNSDYRSYR